MAYRNVEDSEEENLYIYKKETYRNAHVSVSIFHGIALEKGFKSKIGKVT